VQLIRNRSDTATACNTFAFQTPAMLYKSFLAVIVVLLLNLLVPAQASAQQYKLRQVSTTMDMKSESTIYVKGMRKRTESSGFMGMTQPTTIEQCDSQRTIKINDKKKIYFIEPFAKEEEVTDDEKTKEKPKPVAAKAATKTKEGGVITMTYNILDTGERKKVYGLTARRVWTTQKIKPSADACTMKDSMIIKTDGWYIDLPQFNCPVRYAPSTLQRPTVKNQPQCMDRFVTRRTGKGKLGFPIEETRTMIMGNGQASTTEMKTTIETLELSHAKLDSMLFEIPLGYKQVYDEEELQDKMDIKEMMRNANEANRQSPENKRTSKPNSSRGKKIAVLVPTGSEDLNLSAVQEQLVSMLNDKDIAAVAVSSEEDARKENCDLMLSSEFTKFKQASKLGGVLKAIKNTDPFAGATFTIEALLIVKKVSDGSKLAQQKVSGKYEGKAETAATNALDEGCRDVLQKLND
jgi:hypothetical protein